MEKDRLFNAFNIEIRRSERYMINRNKEIENDSYWAPIDIENDNKYSAYYWVFDRIKSFYLKEERGLELKKFLQDLITEESKFLVSQRYGQTLRETFLKVELLLRIFNFVYYGKK